MVLGCVALLVLALMLMTSFSLTNAIHEKIRIQSHADAQAYSLATLEARAFNTIAYHNRAIAATLVAQMSLHSWMSIASHDVAMLEPGVPIMMQFAAAEAALGCHGHHTSHCPCVKAAKQSADNFKKAYASWSGVLARLDRQYFIPGVKGLRSMVETLHREQIAALTRTRDELKGGSVMAALQQTNARGSGYIDALVPLNVDSFTCALEGSSFDHCSDNARPTSSVKLRSQIIENAANAARPPFDFEGPPSSTVSDANFLGPRRAKVPQGCIVSGMAAFWSHEFNTRARVGEGHSSESSPEARARNVGAGSIGSGRASVTNFRHIPKSFSKNFKGDVFSGAGGHHTKGHSGSHNQDPCPKEDCFVNFNALADAERDFGQPTVYGGVIQNLRLRQTKDGQFQDKAPWEINPEGEVKIEMIAGQPTKLKMVARDEGVAVAKAKVYFHQLGNWDVAPNFFDPFWRAKLHFFKRDELRRVLEVSGDKDGVALLNAGAPVEGEE